MTVEAIDAKRLARSQGEAISRFFDTEVPKPGDWLFVVAEKIASEKFLNVAPFYIPRRQLVEGVAFPGLKWPLDRWLYKQIKAGNVAADADWLPGEWVLFDVTERPGYDNGKQMYHDTLRFKEMLATLREQGGILVPNDYRYVPNDSRFAISADEIDGRSGVVARAVASILGLETGQVTTPPYATLNYVGNLAHPELGKVNTSEWLRNSFGYDDRLYGGDSDDGGLSDVHYWRSVDRYDFIGFRLQISPPSKA